MKTGIKIIDAMTSNPITVDSNTSLKDCSKLMAEHKIGGMLVTDPQDNKKLVGILTDQDIVRNVVGEGKNPLDLGVKDIMQTKIQSILPGEDIYFAIRKMGEENIRHLPVIKEGKLIGLITSKDTLKIEPSLFDYFVTKFELREEHSKPLYGGGAGICESCGKLTNKLYSRKGSRVCKRCEDTI